jgi:hypothetical protein
MRSIYAITLLVGNGVVSWTTFLYNYLASEFEIKRDQ